MRLLVRATTSCPWMRLKATWMTAPIYDTRFEHCLEMEHYIACRGQHSAWIFWPTEMEWVAETCSPYSFGT
jgi:hypothetical protein